MLRLALIMLLFACSLQAAPLPSAITGSYLTPERACRLELYRAASPQWTYVDLQCLRFADGLQTSMLSQVFTPGQCPDGTYLAFSFDPRLQTGAPKAAQALSGVWYMGAAGWQPLTTSLGEYFSIRAFAATQLSVLVGLDPTALVNGVGTPQTWVRLPQHDFASRAPYACNAPTVRFRVFGR